MRILYVTASLPFGPGETFIIPELTELEAQGHDVLVVPRSPCGEVVHADAHMLGPITVAEPLLSWRILLAAFRVTLHAPSKAWTALRLMFRSRTPGILLKNLAVYFKGLWLAEVASRWGAQHIHAHWVSTTATMAMVASEISGIRWSTTAHRWDIVENNLLALKCRRAAFIRFISQSGLQLLRNQGLELDCAEKLRVAHMGVAIPPPTQPVASTRQRQVFTLVCPAALLPVKGHTYLFQALAILKHSQVHLLLAGGGPLQPELEDLARRLKLADTIRFMGQLAHEQLLDLYSRAEVDAVVLPSVHLGDGLHEGIPVALMEAMAHGVPAIATATGGIPELLEGGAGLLVPPGDPEALAAAIGRLMGDGQLREALGRAGREKIEREFKITTVVNQLAQWFAEGLKDRGGEGCGLPPATRTSGRGSFI